MPQSYKYSKKRGSYRPTKKPMFGRMDYKIARVARNVVRAYTNAEIKELLDEETVYTQSLGGSTFSLFEPVQGLLVSNRVGNSVKLLSLGLNYTLKMHADATQTNVRVLIFLDKQSNQNKVSVAGLLQNTSLDSFIESHIRYRVTKLYDKMHRLSITGMQGGCWKTHRRINTVVKFDGASGIATKNALIILFIADEPTAQGPTVQFKSRMKYIDN